MTQAQNCEQASKLKDEGNALFVKKDYVAASAKYTEAIALDASNAVLFANRAACRLNLRKYMDAISDAEEATKLDPLYAKAYARRATAHDALGQPWLSVKAWQKAVEVLPKDASIPGIIQQKEQYVAGLATAQKALDKMTTQTSDAFVVPNALKDLLPWNCALRKVPELEREQKFFSSAWIIANAFVHFEEGVNLLNAARVNNGLMTFSTSVITTISNAILTDTRCFHLTDPNWVTRYNQQVMAEAQMVRAWTMAGPDVIKQEAVKRLRDEGWDAVRPALSITVRSWIMHGFLEGGLRANRQSHVEFTARAVEIIKWGRIEWADVSKDDRGVIFEESFLRGVQSRHMEALMQLIKVTRGEAKQAMLEELLMESNEVLKSAENDTMLPRENDPAFAMAFWDYVKGQAYAMQGFYHAQKAVDDDEHIVKTSLCYARAAQCYPEDDEQFTWYMIIAAENMMRSEAPVNLQLSTMEHVGFSLPKVKNIWAQSDVMKSGINVKVGPLLQVESLLRKLLDEGKVTEDMCVRTSYDGRVWGDGKVIHDQ